MQHQKIIQKLELNCEVFKNYFSSLSPEEITWKKKKDKWCCLEILCHLYDEEREDFRTRVRYCLEKPGKELPGIDPVAWVKERNYMAQDFSQKLEDFLQERKKSITWLKSLDNPPWTNGKHHPRFGLRTAEFFLHNWLAHDYLHLRQITRLKYDYLWEGSEADLNYAGNWVLE